MSNYRSRRANILKNLQRQLETISTENGYAHTVHKVSTHVRNWHDLAVAETPVIFIIDENTTYNYNAGRTLEHEWKIGLYGMMKEKSQYEMEEFISDIEECLFKNVTLSFDGQTPGPISHLRILDIITDNQLFSEIEGSQLFKVTINLRYVGCVDNPR